MTTLYEGLQQVATYLDLNLDELMLYADQDEIGGWDGNHELYRWPTGSIWSVEGKVLYALVRATEAIKVAELGTWAGCSASHITQAMLDHDLEGLLTCVDPDQNAGYLILAERGRRIRFKHMDRFEYLADVTDNSLDLLFDDTPKNIEACAQVAREAQRVLRPGGLYITHDADHFLTGQAIQGGLRLGGISDHLTVRMEPSDCGLAIWRKPGEPQMTADEEIDMFSHPIPIKVDLDPAATKPEGIPVEDPRLIPTQEFEHGGQQYVVFSGLTVAELQAELDARGIDYKSRDRKDELIARLVSDDEATD